MLTRQQAQDALTHVLQMLLGFTDTDPLPLSLTWSGYTDIHHVITMTQDNIDALEYEDDTQVLVTVPSPAWTLLRIFNTYHVYRYEEGDPIGDDWTSITAQEFNDFCIGPYPAIINSSPSAYVRRRANATSLSTTPRPHDPVADFKKGIKPDPTLFLDFKMDWQWASWQQSTLTQARAQDVVDVLDPAYVPSLVEDTLLFKEMQKCLHVISEPKLQESDDDNGKDVFIDGATSLDTSHDAQMFLSHAYSIPLATLQGHYNTVHLLPPANGSPTWPPKACHGSQRFFDLSANNQQFFSYLSEIAIEDEDPIPVSTDASVNMPPGGQNTATSGTIDDIIWPMCLPCSHWSCYDVQGTDGWHPQNHVLLEHLVGCWFKDS
jgi:hypothetical protein